MTSVRRKQPGHTNKEAGGLAAGGTGWGLTAGELLSWPRDTAQGQPPSTQTRSSTGTGRFGPTEKGLPSRSCQLPHGKLSEKLNPVIPTHMYQQISPDTCVRPLTASFLRDSVPVCVVSGATQRPLSRRCERDCAKNFNVDTW